MKITFFLTFLPLIGARENNPTPALSIHLPHYTANHNEIIHFQVLPVGGEGGAVVLLEIRLAKY